jgi:pimeloyl-ACP methyl ester carboxylesterase
MELFMTKDLFWTASYARLRLFRKSEENHWNWIFIPGGPGLGSESLIPLLDILCLPGTMWLFDLPGDGSNIQPNATLADWPKALLEVLQDLDNVIMIGHSTGGMFLLSIPELEKYIRGLVLMNSSPDNSWQTEFAPILVQLSQEEENYQNNPTNETLKRFVLAGARYMFTEAGLATGTQMLEKLPYNHDAFHWAKQHFDPIYKAKWRPEEIPTLILSGAKDLATPLKFFSQNKQYHRKNIAMVEIEDAAHFPWIENPTAVANAFFNYTRQIQPEPPHD